MVEARYSGTKVVGVSPDYAEYEKFADIWLPARAGTDGALAIAMTHVILKEFYVDKETPYFSEYVKKRSEEHTSELQSRGHLVCRLLLEKKKQMNTSDNAYTHLIRVDAE